LEKFNINGQKRNDVPAQLLIDHLDEEQIWQQLELKVSLKKNIYFGTILIDFFFRMIQF
jgi:hypothetical protein